MKIENGEALKSSTHGDFEVRTTIRPKDDNWLMRWCIDLEDDAYCDFEFCCSKDFDQTGLELMFSINPEELNRENAKCFFDRIYGG